MQSAREEARIRDRQGMTLVELLIAMVAATAVMWAAYQVLVTNQRVYTVQREQVVGHQTVRAGSEVLFNELREISPTEGDLVSMSANEVTLRGMRGFGLVCQVSPSENRIWAVVHADDFSSEQGLIVFVDDDPGTAADDQWAVASISNLQENSTDCDATVGSGTLVHRITSSGLASGDYAGIRTGAPVRSFQTYTYGSFQVGSDWYLGRRTGSANPVPLVGPVRGRDGVQFDYLTADGSTTSTPSEVRQIRVTIRTRSDARDRQGNPVADSVSARIHLRN
jgi:prepilin-type N-terminal cleavage/methylation domain-containing protein